jgi:hypothetical protein
MKFMKAFLLESALNVKQSENIVINHQPICLFAVISALYYDIFSITAQLNCNYFTSLETINLHNDKS